jgi:PAS domain S-box-containing protein
MAQQPKTTDLEARLRVSEDRLQLIEAASGIGTFDLDLPSGRWSFGPQVAALFGIPSSEGPLGYPDLEKRIFVDDVPKLAAALAAGADGFNVEFRVRGPGGVRWLAARGHVVKDPAGAARLCGAFHDITERKTLDVRLLALNETLQARIGELDEESRTLAILNRTGAGLAAEFDLQRLVQTVTDAGVELTDAAFGAFFYNLINEHGEAYTLYTLSGVPREAFEKFPMPRNTAIFEPTFRGQGVVRSADILSDPRYGKSAPYHGMPAGHLPVRSYLAVPVMSRSGEVLGGLFFGHPEPGVFTDRAERLMSGLAAQAAVAIDNAHLYEARERELRARTAAEQALRDLNDTLEKRVAERAQQLAASSAKVEETEHRFRLLVEAVSDYAIYMLDPDGKVVNWNPGAQRIKGYLPDDVIGQHFGRFYTPEDRQSDVPGTALSVAAATGKYVAEGWRVRKDDSRFWASVVINAIRSSEGNLLGFAKVTRDLTERRAAEERLRQGQKMESIGQLTGGVAHDFNNLLTIILGNLEALQRHLAEPGHDTTRLQRSAEQAMRGAKRAASLTQRLLAFSRQQPLEPRAVDIGRLVTGMSDLLRRTIGEQIAIETALAGGLWRAHVDPNQLENAILNLAVNARDAMPQGGQLTIETANTFLDDTYASSQSEVVPGQYVMVAVSDNGMGMTKEVMEKAFDPFFTTKEIGQGTGLGLSQVYGFVKQSGGHVKIYSEVGDGTTVKIYLPRYHAAGDEESVEQAAPIAPRASGEVILVVEDDPDVRGYSVESLTELGYRVLEAANGAQGLQLLAAHPEIKMLFTDVGLPGGMNGRQLADAARAQRPGLKVLFASGYARNAIVHDGRLDPGVELISKPFTHAALAARVRDILDAGSAPARILLVEDEWLIQSLAVDYLGELGLKVDVAGSATEALNKLGLIPGGVDAAIIDIGLPDRKGDELAREIRAQYPSLPIIFTTGYGAPQSRSDTGMPDRTFFLGKPYTLAGLRDALRAAGIAVPAR